ncbi:endonuclease/exonuclease/phosphatase family protein [Photorhabdus australis]|uniref:endonuclease/exonuclease/phosphatase family protein n=1 Tax=Photorhabdus australis TaxID=286156 RepID=UPI00055A4C9D|nr:endonuclease/exonuclease/phosphatase family protein [Photorhabdus australis]
MVKKTYAIRYVAGQPVERVFPMSAHQLGKSLPVGVPLITDTNGLRVVVWNIYKQQRPSWRRVLKGLTKGSQLILLQEAQTTPDLVEFVTSNYLTADQVPAFVLPQHPSGVMTLATSHPIYCCPLREKEPLLRLSKSALITVYPLQDNRQLMVINVHAINFSFGVDVYSRQLNNIGAHVRLHYGPVIMAGDFNAWSKQRLNALKRFTRYLHLNEVSFIDDCRTIAFGRPLDFIFYRELSVANATVMPTDASDHNPLIVNFY